ncbi:MAG: hypothetical protein LBG48_00625 [Rickettsiales bacterium]|jgi:hypothetical protein|nr:hypothetical protein [Rickettsiales bacterium]
MGSYSHITIGNYPIYSKKNDFDKFYFKKTDRVVRTIKETELNPMIYGVSDSDDIDNIQDIQEYLYIVPGTIMLTRLDLAGYNLQTVKDDFQYIINKRIEDISDLKITDYKKDILFLKHTNIDDWFDALKFTIDNSITSLTKHTSLINKLMFKYLSFMIDEHSFFPLVFPCKNLECLIISILHVTSQDQLCILDITDLVHGGWTDAFKDYESKIPRFFIGV